MRHVIVGIETDNRIPQSDEMMVRVEILAVHAPVAGGKDQEWP